MRQQDVAVLVDYLYWLRDRILSSAAMLPAETFRSTGGTTSRDLRSTLVHELDIEAGWRERLRGAPREDWERELDPDAFNTADALIDEWRRDEARTREWINGLTDQDLIAPATLNGLDGYPTWYYVVHLVTHGIQELGDAAVLLNLAGAPSRDLGFLYYADSRRERT